MIRVSKCCKAEYVFSWLTDKIYYSYCSKCKKFNKVEGELIKWK